MAQPQQVSCDFHDELEALSVRGEPCVVHYLDNRGMEHEATGEIVDLFTRNHREFLKLDGGEVVELIAIREVARPGRAPLVLELLEGDSARDENTGS